MILYDRVHNDYRIFVTWSWTQFMVGFNWYKHMSNFYIALGCLNVYGTPVVYTDGEPE